MSLYDAWIFLSVTFIAGGLVIGEAISKWLVRHGFPWLKRS